MVRKTWAERLAELPEEQRKLVLATREHCGVQASHRILQEYEEKNKK